MTDEVDLPRWIIRRWVVVKDGKVHRFETLPEATAHKQECGGTIRELVFRLSEITTVSQKPEGWIRCDGD